VTVRPIRQLGGETGFAEIFLDGVFVPEMIQLHGAIGITWEHDAHRYFKRAHGAAHLLGRPAEHVARIATAVIDGGRA
jgi:alkylation response protein AidB-like acyl-CoA dehydrogenase